MDQKDFDKKQSLKRIKGAKKGLWTIPCPYCNVTLDLTTEFNFCSECGQEIHERLFFLRKPDSSKETYTFSYKDKRGFITGFTAQRSGKLPNCKILDNDGSVIGEIRGNLLFTRGRTSELSETAKILTDKIETTFGLFTAERQSEESISVIDSHGTSCFNIHALEEASLQGQQRWKRVSRGLGFDLHELRDFRVLSNGKLDPCFIFLASISILEGMFRLVKRVRRDSEGD
ncbi:MAG: hypothetical protein JSW11_05355 [Candidatus Heimdallarchaeota archaeon]|nr:MAG: hypothetical protein JSW11_05355 [Candidatus Heimdallarchaeota archaeon]